MRARNDNKYDGEVMWCGKVCWTCIQSRHQSRSGRSAGWGFIDVQESSPRARYSKWIRSGLVLMSRRDIPCLVTQTPSDTSPTGRYAYSSGCIAASCSTPAIAVALPSGGLHEHLGHSSLFLPSPPMGCCHDAFRHSSWSARRFSQACAEQRAKAIFTTDSTKPTRGVMNNDDTARPAASGMPHKPLMSRGGARATSR